MSSSDGEWDEKKVALVQSQILYWHEKQRAANAHTSAVPGDPDHDAQKLHLLIRHLKTDYDQEDGRKRKGKVPAVSNQADELLARVIANCGSCKRQAQDRKQRKRERAAQESLCLLVKCAGYSIEVLRFIDQASRLLQGTTRAAVAVRSAGAAQLSRLHSRLRRCRG